MDHQHITAIAFCFNPWLGSRISRTKVKSPPFLILNSLTHRRNLPQGAQRDLKVPWEGDEQTEGGTMATRGISRCHSTSKILPCIMSHWYPTISALERKRLLPSNNNLDREEVDSRAWATRISSQHHSAITTTTTSRTTFCTTSKPLTTVRVSLRIPLQRGTKTSKG